MSNFAVLTYKYVKDRPIGVPDGYPAAIIGLGAGTLLPAGPGWQLMNGDDLATLKATYQNGYDRTLISNDRVDRILKAMEFGRLLIARIGADNQDRGLTMPQIMTMMGKSQSVIMALTTGSLYVALAAIGAIVPDDVSTPERLADTRHQIQDYLGIPRT